jgi:hypothetical protein
MAVEEPFAQWAENVSVVPPPQSTLVIMEMNFSLHALPSALM